MLNPSTADASKDDATVTRCIKRARALNYGGILVANLFAYRTTYPAELFAIEEPVGKENDRYLKHITAGAKMVICAWGNHGKHLARDRAVIDMLHHNHVPLFNLGLSKTGHPLHPSTRGKSRCIA